jgi:hypothetical protein
MDEAKYDVFKGTPGTKPLWLGDVIGRQRAMDLVNRTASRLPGDYL